MEASLSKAVLLLGFEKMIYKTSPEARGQASLEQLVMLATAIAFVAVAFYLASSYASDTARISQAQDAVGRLASAADHVYALGPNSKEYVTVYMPEGIFGTRVTGSELLIIVSTSSGNTDVYATSKAALIGAMPSGTGRQDVLVEYLASGKVRIGEAGLVCSPSFISHSLNAGENGSDSITISNALDYDLTDLTVDIGGDAEGMVSVDGLASSIASGESDNLTVNYNVPESQMPGAYGATLQFDSANGSLCITQLTLQVNGVYTCAGLCSQAYDNGTCRTSCNVDEIHVSDNDFACSAPETNCCCGPVAVPDTCPVATVLASAPENVSSNGNVTITGYCNDTANGGSDITMAEGRLDGANASSFDATDGAFSSALEGVTHQFDGPFAPGVHVAEIRCFDASNANCSYSTPYYFNVSMADTIGPIVTFMNHSDAFPTTLANITEFGTATDVYTGNANVVECSVKVDSGEWMNSTEVDGFGTPTVTFNYSLGQMSSGMHTIYSKCKDELGNWGGEYNDTFGISDADVMLVMDISGSMAWLVVNDSNSTVVTTTSNTYTKVKSIQVNALNGELANITIETKSSSGSCSAQYEARVGATVLASGSRASTSYGATVYSANISSYSTPFTLDLYLRRTGSCTAYSQRFEFTQTPSKISAAQVAAGAFVDIVDNSTQAGLVSYSNTASTVRTLSLMSTSNRATLKNSINGLSPTGSTCTQCGLINAIDELTSARSRYPDGLRVVILLTDGASNLDVNGNSGSNYCVGALYDTAVTARENNVTVYTIGFGYDVNDAELINIALQTGGQYYFAPDQATLEYIYRHIGQ
jgi:Mg-chelatase subunit ChlD/uncharacterized protein (UPF0333 family)